jgi:hypothetical protein
MDLSIVSEVIGQDDQRWLGTAHGTSAGDSITLDASAFTAEHPLPERLPAVRHVRVAEHQHQQVRPVHHGRRQRHRHRAGSS